MTEAALARSFFPFPVGVWAEARYLAIVDIQAMMLLWEGECEPSNPEILWALTTLWLYLNSCHNCGADLAWNVFCCVLSAELKFIPVLTWTMEQKVKSQLWLVKLFWRNVCCHVAPYTDWLGGLSFHYCSGEYGIVLKTGRIGFLLTFHWSWYQIWLAILKQEADVKA